MSPNDLRASKRSERKWKLCTAHQRTFLHLHVSVVMSEQMHLNEALCICECMCASVCDVCGNILVCLLATTKHRKYGNERLSPMWMSCSSGWGADGAWECSAEMPYGKKCCWRNSANGHQSPKLKQKNFSHSLRYHVCQKRVARISGCRNIWVDCYEPPVGEFFFVVGFCMCRSSLWSTKNLAQTGKLWQPHIGRWRIIKDKLVKLSKSGFNVEKRFNGNMWCDRLCAMTTVMCA